MNRIDEKESAKSFVQKIMGKYYNYERSINTEVVYKDEKEERDTIAVKELTETRFFSKFKEMI